MSEGEAVLDKDGNAVSISYRDQIAAAKLYLDRVLGPMPILVAERLSDKSRDEILQRIARELTAHDATATSPLDDLDGGP